MALNNRLMIAPCPYDGGITLMRPFDTSHWKRYAGPRVSRSSPSSFRIMRAGRMETRSHWLPPLFSLRDSEISSASSHRYSSFEKDVVIYPSGRRDISEGGGVISLRIIWLG